MTTFFSPFHNLYCAQCTHKGTLYTVRRLTRLEAISTILTIINDLQALSV